MTSIDYFYKLLSRREYSVRELTQKAQAKGFDLQEIAKSIEDLQEQNYQSDSRVVESLITSYHGKYGKSLIKRKCLEKGINSDLFEEIWASQTEEEDTGELDELKAKVMRKYKIDNFRSIEQKTKVKLWNYLQYRGFNPGQVLAQWQREQDEMVE
ncbi:regulatory protein RecX [Limnofasciculus baicalensis]|uniref:Regulatory protein RecX n=1 Tax=Limnofasciculus baicalensis BBK-W-15 TaxID=2699891 RepID=A0AAE3KS38_9CYAN|nr:regulatory protein RecX [Limnofasciculus baicalensis]MCP2729092.1 recombination regulator RecX [Limnofasciculus baicalensis BBK-W-15]